jgi:hypothetical protein
MTAADLLTRDDCVGLVLTDFIACAAEGVALPADHYEDLRGDA